MQPEESKEEQPENAEKKLLLEEPKQEAHEEAIQDSFGVPSAAQGYGPISLDLLP